MVPGLAKESVEIRLRFMNDGVGFVSDYEMAYALFMAADILDIEVENIDNLKDFKRIILERRENYQAKNDREKWLFTYIEEYEIKGTMDEDMEEILKSGGRQ